MSIRLNERFKPHPDFKKLQYIQLSIAILSIIVLGLTLMLLVSFQRALVFILSLIFLALCLIISIPSIIWINLYYLSVFYTFTEDEIIVERGIWWKHKSIVPYNRITNVDMRQGPLSRALGLWEVRIQTAGYHIVSGGVGAAEAILQGIKNVEEVKSFILGRIRELKPIAIEAGSETTLPKVLEQQILEELREIRRILERKG
ncbi:MAG: PH domain-containing protein [Candidatus Brockarchaeota archaeon]|nr:PH domain-containing protein [Candidatus Brockarchaeota archaeon]MBO3840507.1 PH domain-containing protein [Candidatus Brockarchaeota archaeon]